MNINNKNKMMIILIYLLTNRNEYIYTTYRILIK